MPIAQKNYSVKFTPKGLSDAFDSSDAFFGACTVLANLVFDQGNPELAVSRPGTITIVDFTAANNYLNLTGATGGYASTPSSAANQAPVGRITIAAYIVADAAGTIMAKWQSGQEAYRLVLNSDGSLTFNWSLIRTASSTAVISTVFTTGMWVRVSRTAATGTTSFYYSSDPSTTDPVSVNWTQLGADVVGSVSNIDITTAILEVGSSEGGTVSVFDGRILVAKLYSDTTMATLRASMVASDTTVGAGSWVSTLTGETWTVNGAASIQGSNFAGAGVISVQETIGNITYGMISTTRNTGKDEPFAYDNSTSTFLPISGVTNATSPTTQATSGAWTPPTIAQVGVNVIVTHPGFPGGATKFGWFDTTTPGAPVWNAGDTTTNALSAVPTSVANFANRAYFAVGKYTEYTDVLTLVRTASSQALTIGDASNVTALSGLPVQTTSSGVVQALVVFKAFQVWQVTGDPATNNLALNYISLQVGCEAPRSVKQAPGGIYFASISGPMIVNQLGFVKPVTNAQDGSEADVKNPWQNAVVPSRIAAGYSGTVYRLCMQTVLLGNNQTKDYWFDERRRRWNGPHSFTYDCVSQYGNYFVLASNANPAKLIKSESMQSVNSVFTDLGTTITCTQTPSTFPKTGHMTVKQVVESTQELAASSAAATFQITAIDDQGTTLDTCTITVSAPGTLWGSGVWGSFSWASGYAKPRVYTVPWTQPLVFKKMAQSITSNGNAALSFGTFYARYQDAGYMNVPTS